MRGAIVALSPQRVIGAGGQLPWHYPADLRRFKQLTVGGTIIMGRKTWDSIAQRALPQRRNIVISRQRLTNVDNFDNIDDALTTTTGDIWFIGGAALYEAALAYCDLVDTTIVPDLVEADDAVYFPELDPLVWTAGPVSVMLEDPRLKLCRYHRVNDLTV